jgi:LIVCS family branched-chain amino acid:cation transporter
MHTKLGPPPLKMNRMSIAIGFAIFAMFFGAGNLVFPLAIGVHAGYDNMAAIVGFTLSGVIVPLLGLYVISLYHGNYMDFLSHIGRLPSFIVASILVSLLGILVATPRTGLLSFNTLHTFFPVMSPHRMLFNGCFFALIYLISFQQMRIIDAIGYILSPLKLFVLFVLICFGLGIHHHIAPPSATLSPSAVFMHAIKYGYATMDLLASFFFCAFVHKTICHKLATHQAKISVQLERRITLNACLIGALLLGIVYSLFILVANFHSVYLQHVPIENMIGALAQQLFHQYGGIFVSICITLACFSTAIALTAITVEFIQIHILRGRLHYHFILPMTLITIFAISNLGFSRIMATALPILSILYPALLALTIGNIFYKLKGWNFGAWFFYITLCLEIIYFFVK